mgnify:CR=1 FL=1
MTSHYLTLEPRTEIEAKMEIRRHQLRTLAGLEIAENDAWDRGDRVLSISYRKRAIALRNLLALTNSEVPESADEEARRLSREAQGHTTFMPVQRRGEL